MFLYLQAAIDKIKAAEYNKSMKLIYDKQKLYEILKEFHSITNIRISFLEDHESPVIGVPWDNSGLCMLKQKEDPAFYQRCKTCDREASRLAATGNDVYIYECHYCLTEAIQPVKVNGRPLGYFLLGQILTDREKFIRQNRPNEKELALLDELAFCSPDTLRSYAKILSWLAQYTVLNNDIRLCHKESFETINAYIREHYAEALTVDFLCSQFHYSRSALFALFKEECRQGIMEYINSVRLEKSKELLNEWKIVEVSRMVGISDSNYFSRIFKKKYGISPEHYKQKFLVKEAP